MRKILSRKYLRMSVGPAIMASRSSDISIIDLVTKTRWMRTRELIYDGKLMHYEQQQNFGTLEH